MKLGCLALICLAVLSAAAGTGVAGEGSPAAWHHPLYLPGDGYWRQRIPLTVENRDAQPAEGANVALPIGPGPGQADLAGQPTDELRLCDAKGTELLWAVVGPDGNAVESGPIPAGSTLLVPAVCEARQTVTYYLYFDNPAAWALPDFLPGRTTIVNGDVEAGQGDTPSGWRHDPPDDQHHAVWTTEQPQSGRRCLKTTVAAGAQPTWIGTRQSGIQVAAGAAYTLRAWVRAEEVRGFCGWFAHVGNQQNSQMLSLMLKAGDGTFGWKEVSARFTVPAGATGLEIGTVLRGTGTAWFDHVALECHDPGSVRVTAGRAEKIRLREVGTEAGWQAGYDYRAVVRLFNYDAAGPSRGLVMVDAAALDGRMRGHLNRDAVVVVQDGQPLPHFLRGGMLLFEAGCPARSLRELHIYFSDDPALHGSGKAAASNSAQRNRLENGNFEHGGSLPDDWTHNRLAHDPATYGLDDAAAPGAGGRAVKMHVPAAAPRAWRGWRQAVAVEPDHDYLVSAWIKCQDVSGGEAAMHAHCHDAHGKICRRDGMQSLLPGVQGTADWTLLARLVHTPADAASLEIHLTMMATGTVWHSGVMVVEAQPGPIVRWEGRPLPAGAGVRLWQASAVTKVFPDDVARPPAPARASLARNERQAVQLAVRGGQDVSNVQVQIDPPVSPSGARLAGVNVEVVGYVPVDHPSSYYNIDVPAWQRKITRQSGACDGWAGLWPDPLLPQRSLDLKPNFTQAVWLTLTTAKDTPPGDYRGRVRLTAGGATLAETPLEVHVWGFTLPDESHVGALYEVHPNGPMWGGDHQQALLDVVRFMAQRRVHADAFEAAPVLKYQDGQVTADFTAFDRQAAVFFDECHIPYCFTPGNFYLFGWGHPPGRKFGQEPYPGEPPFDGADRSRLRPEFKTAYKACLKAFWDHVKAKGWQQRFVMYISDEPFDRQPQIITQMKALCDLVHEVDPAIPIYSSTWHHVPDWNGYLNVWGFGHVGMASPEVMRQRQAAGDRLWYTTDGQMCIDTPYTATERLLPLYCFKYGVEAYEFWSATWLTYDPFRFGWHGFNHQSEEPGKQSWVRFPSGDGYLVYPGRLIGHDGPVSSIRLEQAGQGVEDYEYLYLLRNLVTQAKAAGRDVTAGEAALKAARALVTIPNAGGRFTTKILSNADDIFTMRAQVAAAIEGLAQ